MDAADRVAFPAWALRLALAVLVLAWILGAFRSALPLWIVFAVALGLELQFLLSAVRPPPERALDRRPQPADRERFGYGEPSELLLVDDGDRELWIPYAGESGEELDELIEDARAFADEDEDAPALGRARSRWPAVRRFLTGLAVIAGLAFTALLVESRSGWSAVDGEARIAAVERYSEEASRIAGKPVTIACDESRDYVGFVQHTDGVAFVGGDRAYLTPEICHDLYRLAFDGEVTGTATGRALAVLAHEAWHLRGERDEARTECYALQSGAGLGRRLGLSENRARQLMRQQLTENALRGGASIEYRTTADCRDGGPLDLRPGDSRFP